jgi:hypothetical protein
MILGALKEAKFFFTCVQPPTFGAKNWRLSAEELFGLSSSSPA